MQLEIVPMLSAPVVYGFLDAVDPTHGVSLKRELFDPVRWSGGQTVCLSRSVLLLVVALSVYRFVCLFV